VADGRWITFAGPREIYGDLGLLGRTLLVRTRLAGAARGTFWGAGPLVCPVLVQIPIASTATNESAGHLDRFINFLCPLNIINVVLLQASTETNSNYSGIRQNYLLGCRSQLACCNLRSETYNLQFFTGVLAQSVERLNGIEEVTGSNPVGSIFFRTSRGRSAVILR
jgi:hypothetical protein